MSNAYQDFFHSYFLPVQYYSSSTFYLNNSPDAPGQAAAPAGAMRQAQGGLPVEHAVHRALQALPRLGPRAGGREGGR